MEKGLLKKTSQSLEEFVPTTSYYQLKSTYTDREYGIWITLPLGYNANSGYKYPVIYVQDGNLLAPFLGGIYKVMAVDELIPLNPFITVSIGYKPDDAPQTSFLRMNDFLPLGEPENRTIIEALERNVQLGLMTEADKEFGVAQFRNSRAHDFLKFIYEELHPQIVSMLAVDEKNCGMFGHSLGGLFVLYAFLNENSTIKNFGVSSPAMLSEETKILEILQEKINNGTKFSERNILTSMTEYEIVSPKFYQDMTHCFNKFNGILSQSQLSGVNCQTCIISDATHATGLTIAWLRFLREFYRK